MNETKEVQPNRDIEAFLLAGNFEIQEQWGLEQLANYCNEIAALRAGVPYAELGIGQRRAASMPGLITMHAGEMQFIQSPEALRSADVPEGSFAHLKLQGVMRSQDGMSSRGVSSLVGDLQAAFQNPNIDGILLETNTGGGESLSGTILQSALADSPKPVVVYAHLLASAGIRGTVTATEIIASGQGAQFGSIGTFVTLDKSFAKWYASWYEDVYADKSANKNADFRAYLQGDKAPLQSSINRSNDIFLNEVRQFRDLRGNAASIEHTLSGAMFSAQEAKSRGLVDAIGSLSFATQRLAAHARRRKTM